MVGTDRKAGHASLLWESVIAHLGLGVRPRWPPDTRDDHDLAAVRPSFDGRCARSSDCATDEAVSRRVRIGIWDFNSDPGLVWALPLRSSWRRSATSRRSIVAGDMPTSKTAVRSSTSNSPWRRSEATRSGSAGASRFPVAPSNVAQHTRSASTTCPSYFNTGGRGFRCGVPGPDPERSATPSGHDHDANRSTRTTHQAPPFAPISTRDRSGPSAPSSPACALPHPAPSLQPDQPPPTSGHFQMSQRIRLRGHLG
jgi:hypothetical protein